MISSKWETIQNCPLERRSRAGAASIIIGDNKVESLVVFGGESGKRFLNDLHLYEPMTKTWSEIETPIPRPCQRSGHSMTTGQKDEFFVFGGESDTSFKSDLWRFSFNAYEWTKMTNFSTTQPSPRYGAAMAYVSNRLVVYGGAVLQAKAKTFASDTWIYDLVSEDGENSGKWKKIENVIDRPCPRFLHTLTAVNNVLYLFGGFCGSRLNDTWSFDVFEEKWTKLKPDLNPPARASHAACSLDDQRLCIFGGRSDSSLDDCWVYTPEDENEGIWAEMTLDAGPTGRYDHIMSELNGRQLIVYGGSGGRLGNYNSDIWILDTRGSALNTETPKSSPVREHGSPFKIAPLPRFSPRGTPRGADAQIASLKASITDIARTVSGLNDRISVISTKNVYETSFIEEKTSSDLVLLQKTVGAAQEGLAKSQMEQGKGLKHIDQKVENLAQIVQGLKGKLKDMEESNRSSGAGLENLVERFEKALVEVEENGQRQLKDRLDPICSNLDRVDDEMKKRLQIIEDRTDATAECVEENLGKLIALEQGFIPVNNAIERIEETKSEVYDDRSLREENASLKALVEQLSHRLSRSEEESVVERLAVVEKMDLMISGLSQRILDVEHQVADKTLSSEILKRPTFDQLENWPRLSELERDVGEKNKVLCNRVEKIDEEFKDHSARVSAVAMQVAVIEEDLKSNIERLESEKKSEEEMRDDKLMMQLKKIQDDAKESALMPTEQMMSRVREIEENDFQTSEQLFKFKKVVQDEFEVFSHGLEDIRTQSVDKVGEIKSRIVNLTEKTDLIMGVNERGESNTQEIDKMKNEVAGLQTEICKKASLNAMDGLASRFGAYVNELQGMVTKEEFNECLSEIRQMALVLDGKAGLEEIDEIKDSVLLKIEKQSSHLTDRVEVVQQMMEDEVQKVEIRSSADFIALKKTFSDRIDQLAISLDDSIDMLKSSSNSYVSQLFKEETINIRKDVVESVDEVKTNLEHQVSNCDSLREDLASLKENILISEKNVSRDLKKLKEEKDLIKDDVESQQRITDSLLSNLEEMQSEIVETKVSLGEVNFISDKVKDLEKSIDKSIVDGESTKQRMQVVDQQLELLKSQLESFSTSSAGLVNELSDLKKSSVDSKEVSASIDSLAEKVASIELKIEDDRMSQNLKSSVYSEEVSASIDSLAEKVASIELKIEEDRMTQNLKSSVDSKEVSASIDSLAEKVASIELEIEEDRMTQNLKSSVDSKEVSASIDSLAEKVASIELKIEDDRMTQEEGVAVLNAIVVEREKEIGELKTQTEDIGLTNEGTVGRLNDIEDRLLISLTQHEEEIAKLVDGHAELTKNGSILNEIHDSYSKQLSSLQDLGTALSDVAERVAGLESYKDVEKDMMKSHVLEKFTELEDRFLILSTQHEEQIGELRTKTEEMVNYASVDRLNEIDERIDAQEKEIVKLSQKEDVDLLKTVREAQLKQEEALEQFDAALSGIADKVAELETAETQYPKEVVEERISVKGDESVFVDTDRQVLEIQRTIPLLLDQGLKGIHEELGAQIREVREDLAHFEHHARCSLKLHESELAEHDEKIISISKTVGDHLVDHGNRDPLLAKKLDDCDEHLDRHRRKIDEVQEHCNRRSEESVAKGVLLSTQFDQSFGLVSEEFASVEALAKGWKEDLDSLVIEKEKTNQIQKDDVSRIKQSLDDLLSRFSEHEQSCLPSEVKGDMLEDDQIVHKPELELISSKIKTLENSLRSVRNQVHSDAQSNDSWVLVSRRVDMLESKIDESVKDSGVEGLDVVDIRQDVVRIAQEFEELKENISSLDAHRSSEEVDKMNIRLGVVEDEVKEIISDVAMRSEDVSRLSSRLDGVEDVAKGIISDGDIRSEDTNRISLRLEKVENEVTFQANRVPNATSSISLTDVENLASKIQMVESRLDNFDMEREELVSKESHLEVGVQVEKLELLLRNVEEEQCKLSESVNNVEKKQSMLSESLISLPSSDMLTKAEGRLLSALDYQDSQIGIMQVKLEDLCMQQGEIDQIATVQDRMAVAVKQHDDEISRIHSLQNSVSDEIKVIMKGVEERFSQTQPNDFRFEMTENTISQLAQSLEQVRMELETNEEQDARVKEQLDIVTLEQRGLAEMVLKVGNEVSDFNTEIQRNNEICNSVSEQIYRLRSQSVSSPGPDKAIGLNSEAICSRLENVEELVVVVDEIQDSVASVREELHQFGVQIDDYHTVSERMISSFDELKRLTEANQGEYLSSQADSLIELEQKYEKMSSERLLKDIEQSDATERISEELFKMSKKIDNEVQAFSDRISSIDAASESLKKAFDGVETRSGGFLTMIDNIKQKISGLEENVDGVVGVSAKAAETIGAQQMSLRDVQRRLLKDSEDIEFLKNKVAENVFVPHTRVQTEASVHAGDLTDEIAQSSEMSSQPVEFRSPETVSVSDGGPGNQKDVAADIPPLVPKEKRTESPKILTPKESSSADIQKETARSPTVFEHVKKESVSAFDDDFDPKAWEQFDAKASNVVGPTELNESEHSRVEPITSVSGLGKRISPVLDAEAWFGLDYKQSQIKVSRQLRCLCLGEERFVVGDVGGSLWIYDVGSLSKLRSMNVVSSPCSSVAMLSEASLLVSAFEDNSLHFHNMTSGESLGSLTPHSSSIFGLDIDSRFLLTSSRDRTMKLIHRESLETIGSYEGHSRAIYCCQLTDDVVISGSGDHLVKTWSVQRVGKNIATFRGHTGRIRCLHNCGNIIATGSSDRTARLWDLRAARATHILKGHADMLTAVQVDRQRLLSSSQDGIVRLWDLRKGVSCIHALKIGGGALNDSAFLSSQKEDSKNLLLAVGNVISFCIFE